MNGPQAASASQATDNGKGFNAVWLAAVALPLVLTAAWLHAGDATWTFAVICAVSGGLVASLVLGLTRPLRLRGGPRAAVVLSEDLRTLQKAFRVLQLQVQTTIGTSESAVMSLNGRLQAIFERAQDLLQRAESDAEGLDAAERRAAVVADLNNITNDIVEALGETQFQDINRQMLERIDLALGSLGEHFLQIHQLVEGSAPPPPQMLHDLLQTWTSSYVMHAQRVAHCMALGEPIDHLVDATVQPTPMQAATGTSARVELF